MESQDIAIGIVVSVVLGLLLVLILKKIAESKGFMETLHIMCSKGDIWYVKRHLDNGSDVNAKDEEGVTPLHYAAEGGFNEIVELLIDKGANVNAKNDDSATPLDVAIQFKEFETAALLRKHGGKHVTIYSADVSGEDSSTHRSFVRWFLWSILGVINFAILIYLFAA
ncbi:MAG: ankyrin repeat domain-containing protein [Nitrospinaceae bacterium]|jgi:hypothetical protein|nr:ankyrin repeat domain-containing protein [Nitrospinaceae bacterium]